MNPPIVLLHGLTFDRRHFDPMIRSLAAVAPGRQVLALDLPGHGDAPPRASYHRAAVAEALHEQIGHLPPPVLVGHSVSAILATTYAARYPAHAVLNLDQPLLTGPFGAAVRAAEPVLRSPGWRTVWDGFLAGMGIPALPSAARELVETATDPRPDLLLGYWDEILRHTDEELTTRTETDLRTLTARAVAYHWVTAAQPHAPYRAWLAEQLPQAGITVLPGGHFPHLSHPGEVARIAAAL